MEGKVIIFNHPLMHHKLTLIRDEKTCTKDFRETVEEIAMLMAYEVTRNLPTVEKKIKTPIATMKGQVLAKEVVIVPIIRAGIGMVDGILKLVPTAKVGYVGVYRDDKTLLPHEYYVKLPEKLDQATILVVDPMLATGGSANHTINLLKKRNAKDISFVGIVGAPEGIKVLQDNHPDVNIFLAALDEKLNDNGYIVPGLGDCGDRLYGTK